MFLSTARTTLLHQYANARCVSVNRFLSSAAYAVQLAKHSRSREPSDVLSIFQNMKETGATPTLLHYGYVLDNLARNGLYLEARAVFEDMQRLGLAPSEDQWHALLQSTVTMKSAYMWQVLEEMVDAGLSQDEVTRSIVLDRIVAKGDVEPIIRLLLEMIRAGHPLSRKRLAQQAISKIAKSGYPRLAIDLAQRVEATSVSRLDIPLWVDLLESSAEYLYAPGIRSLWQRLRQHKSFKPTEGLCLAILTTIPHILDTRLGSEVTLALQENGLTISTPHGVPLLIAYLKTGQFQEAVTFALSFQMEEVAERLVVGILVDIGLTGIHQLQSIIADRFKNGKEVDHVLSNAIIQSLSRLDEAQGAFNAYDELANCGIPRLPNTFHALLSLCATHALTARAISIAQAMKYSDCTPNVETLAELMLQAINADEFVNTQKLYRTTKKHDLRVYDALAQKSLDTSDDRWRSLAP